MRLTLIVLTLYIVAGLGQFCVPPILAEKPTELINYGGFETGDFSAGMLISGAPPSADPQADPWLGWLEPLFHPSYDPIHEGAGIQPAAIEA